VASGATIGGQRRRVQTNVNWEGFGWAGKLAWWLAVSVSTLVVGLVLLWLVGRGAAWILEAGRTGIGPAIGWGLLAFFGLPILAIIALLTLVGIPLGLGVLAALGLIYALGYGASAWIVGRRILREPTAWILAFLVGWGILRVLALVPHPWWPGLVRRGGLRPWRAAGGHLASPHHQPCRSSSRLTGPVLVVSHSQVHPGAEPHPAHGRAPRSFSRGVVPRSRRQSPKTAGSRAAVWRRSKGQAVTSRPMPRASSQTDQPMPAGPVRHPHLPRRHQRPATRTQAFGLTAQPRLLLAVSDHPTASGTRPTKSVSADTCRWRL
jgi:hypothetical protein